MTGLTFALRKRLVIVRKRTLRDATGQRDKPHSRTAPEGRAGKAFSHD